MKRINNSDDIGVEVMVTTNIMPLNNEKEEVENGKSKRETEKSILVDKESSSWITFLKLKIDLLKTIHQVIFMT